MTNEAYPFFTISDEFAQLHILSQQLGRIRQLLNNDEHHSSIKAELIRHKQELNFRLNRLDKQYRPQMTKVQQQQLDEMKQTEHTAAPKDPVPSLEDTIHSELSATKQHWEERLKQEMGMHHILPTRPEELYKVVLIYLAIFKIHEGTYYSQNCAALIEGLKNPETRQHALHQAKLFFKQLKNPKAFVAIAESVIHAVFGEGQLGYLMNLLSRLITYPLSDILHFTGLHQHLPFPDEYAQHSPVSV